MIDGWPGISESGFDGLRLGDRQADVRERYGPPAGFRRAGGPAESDLFADHGLVVTYDQEGSVEFIEIARPADPVLRGVKLLERPLRDVVTDLAGIGVRAKQMPEEFEGPVLKGLGIGLWVPGETVEAVSIGDEESLEDWS